MDVSTNRATLSRRDAAPALMGGGGPRPVSVGSLSH
jgi:hypothetical protein